MKAYDRFKADGYTLKVYDAYRPIRVQRILFNIVKNKHWIANPDTTASNHNRGCAIDMSLIIDATGEEMEFPTPMHTFRRNPPAPANMERCGPRQRGLHYRSYGRMRL